MKENEAKDKIVKVGERWFLTEPLLFNTFCTHKMVPNKNLHVPFRTGGMKIEFEPELINQLSDSQISSLLQVEMYRILLKHPYERMPLTPNRAALACASDITISDACTVTASLEDHKYRNLPEGLSYEEYYERLKYMFLPNTISSSRDSDEDDGEGEEDAEENSRKMIQQSMEFSKENYSEKAALWNEDEEARGKINEAIEQASKNNQWGSVSGDIKELIEASLIIPMDYRRILKSFRVSITASDERKLTRMKPNRRYGFEYMGSKYKPQTNLLIGVDNSGSISERDLKNFFSIINRFFKYGIKQIDVAQFDTEIKSIVSLRRASKTVKIEGRGGTDFQAIIDLYVESSKYDGLIIFTDGYADKPVMNKEKPVLWIFTNKDCYEYGKSLLEDHNKFKATFIPSST